MKFFQRFPTLQYRTTEVGSNSEVQLTRTVPNMTVSLKLTIGDDEGTSFWFYRVKDRDRPDTVSAQFYGSSEYAWVILLANKMQDWYDWPLTDHEFAAYINRKYESVPGLNDGIVRSKRMIHQRLWLLPDGQKLALDEPGYLAKIAEGALIVVGESAFDPSLNRDGVCEVSVYTKEYEDNDSRRLIRVPTLSALQSVKQQLAAVLKG